MSESTLVAPSEHLLTKEEAAVYLKVSTRTLETYVKNKIIQPIYYGRAVRFRKEDLNNPSSNQSKKA